MSPSPLIQIVPFLGPLDRFLYPVPPWQLRVDPQQKQQIAHQQHDDDQPHH